MDEKSAGQLQEHMLGTYDALRIMLTLIGFALPVIVAGAGCLQRGYCRIGASISDYYYLPSRFPFFTTRDLFVGGLLAAAVCLYSYKGFSTRENVALNLAGVFACFIALVPTAANPQDVGLRSKVHGAAAVLFFLSIAYVSLRRSRDTLRLLPQRTRDRYARIYFLTGAAMVASPAIAVVLSFAIEPSSPSSTWIFFVETLGVWAFASYWFVKTREMHETDADRRAMDAELKRQRVPPVPLSGTDGTSVRAIDRAIRRAMVPDKDTVERIVPNEAE
jgi:hypothetical protein